MQQFHGYTRGRTITTPNSCSNNQVTIHREYIYIYIYIYIWVASNTGACISLLLVASLTCIAIVHVQLCLGGEPLLRWPNFLLPIACVLIPIHHAQNHSIIYIHFFRFCCCCACQNFCGVPNSCCSAALMRFSTSCQSSGVTTAMAVSASPFACRCRSI